MTRRVRNYELHEVAGEGGQGIVWRATDATRGRSVAVKSLRSVQMGVDLESEFLITERLRGCENIVECYEYFRHDDGLYYIVSEWVGGGALFDMIEPGVGIRNIDFCRRVFRGIIQGVFYCHSRGVAHRDLKPENIMLAEDYRTPKIIDFGLSKVFENDDDLLRTKTGTKYYAAPEVFRGSYTREADIWSLGVILYAMLVGDFPYYSHTDRRYQRIKRGEYVGKSWEFLLNTFPAVYDLLRGMLTVDVANRWRIPDIWNSVFLQEGGWILFPPLHNEQNGGGRAMEVDASSGGNDDENMEETSNRLSGTDGRTQAIADRNGNISINMATHGSYRVFLAMPTVSAVTTSLPAKVQVHGTGRANQSLNHEAPVGRQKLLLGKDALLQMILSWAKEQGGEGTMSDTAAGEIDVALPTRYGGIQMRCLSEACDGSGYAVRCIRRGGSILEFNRLRNQLFQYCQQRV